MAVAVAYRPAPLTLDDIKDPAREDIYPTQALEGAETALVLFCGRWYGRQDAYFVAEAGLQATCLDIDPVPLEAMRNVYPDGWEFLQADAFKFAETTYDKWDVVSLDPFTELFPRCASYLPAWCKLARRTVILGTGHNTSVTAPKGWHISEIVKRTDYAGGVYWTVLERK